MHAKLAFAHILRIEPHAASTLGACSCGAWHREVTTETVALTGRSREEALRHAHEEHVRELTPAPLAELAPRAMAEDGEPAPLRATL